VSLLQPHDRATLLDALRPPAGFAFDAAVATTYSLHLEALLTAPLAFALYDTVASDGEDSAGSGMPGFEPITVLEAVRRYAARITVFCQAGQISVPPARPVLAWLEKVVVEVAAPTPGGVFHPKTWLIRYRRPLDGAAVLRFLCLSRNLTFDRSWDTILRLDSHVLGSKADICVDTAPLRAFVEALPGLALRETSPERRATVAELAADLAGCAFSLPEGCSAGVFWPLGVPDDSGDPLPSEYRRSLTISPFITPGRLAAISATGEHHVLVSRQEELDRLAPGTLHRFAHVFTFSSDTDLAVVANESTAPVDDDTDVPARDDDPGTSLTGLHAKVIVAERRGEAVLLTGSANATTAAFERNVEFVTELTMPRVSVAHVLREGEGEAGLSRLLQPYEAPEHVAERSPEQQLEDELDIIRREIATRPFSAEVIEAGDPPFVLQLNTGEALIGSELDPWVRATCWPVTMNRTVGRPVELGAVFELAFPCSIEGITSFFAFELVGRRDGVEASTRFVINAPLSGVPENRETRIIAAILRDPGRFVRYLLLLLGDPSADDQLAGEAAAWFGATAHGTEGQQDIPVFEVLVRALARYPERLDHVASLLDELVKSDDGRAVLPEGFEQLWEPLWQAREALGHG
jgi:hypothetical protein